nr:MAG TPA: hypothetical protein [Caudoviricetes sp.]
MPVAKRNISAFPLLSVINILYYVKCQYSIINVLQFYFYKFSMFDNLLSDSRT